MSTVMAYQVVSNNPSVQSRYVELRESGQSHNMAEILATKAFPGTRTDREFQKGRCNGNQFENLQIRGDWYRSQAEQAGVSTTGKFYHDGLAEYPGDPTAWVSDRGDVLRVAREKGVKVSGLVDYTPPDFYDQEPKPDVPVDPSLIAAEVDDIVEANPGVRPGDIAEKIYELRSGAVDPNPQLVNDYNPDDHLVDFN